MNTIINDRTYETLLRASVKKGYILVSYILYGVALLQIGISLIVTGLDIDGFLETGVWFLIPMTFLILIGAIFTYMAKKVDRSSTPHFSYEPYVHFQTRGTKAPLYRIINYGKHSETVYELLELDGDMIKLFDIRRKKLHLHIEALKEETTFKFFFKQKQGLEVIKTKIQLVINGKKRTVFGLKEVNERLLQFLKNEGYNVETVK